MAGKFKHSGGKQQEGGKDPRSDEKTRQLKVSVPLIEQTRQQEGSIFAPGKTVPVEYPPNMLELSRTAEPDPATVEDLGKPLPPPPLGALVTQPKAMAPQKEASTATVNPQALQNALDTLTKAINDLSKRLTLVEQYHTTTLRERMTANDAELQQIEAELGSLRQELDALKQNAVNLETLDSYVERVLDSVSELVAEVTDKFDADVKKLTDEIDRLKVFFREISSKHNELVDSWAELSRLRENVSELGSLRQELDALKQNAVNLETLGSYVERVLDSVSELVAGEVNKATDKFDVDVKKLTDEIDRLKVFFREISSKHNELVDSWAELSRLHKNVSEFERVLSNLLTNFESFLASVACASNTIIDKIRNNGGSNE